MSVSKSIFGVTPTNDKVFEYTLRNNSGMEIKFLSYGLKLHKIITPDKSGNLADVILGYDKLDQYLGMDFQGSFVGRFANRIGNASFILDDHKYELEKNDGQNILHSGSHGLYQVLWSENYIDNSDTPSVTMSYSSKEFDEGFPGNMDISIKYSLSEDNELSITYKAVSDAKTPFNPTNHSFFNLSGNHSKNILDTVLKINASHFTEVSDDLIPTGNILSVSNTPLDFRIPKTIGNDIFCDDHIMSLCGGYDHNFCVDGTGMRIFAEAYEPTSGRTLIISSDLPGVQLYTFNKTAPVKGKNQVIMTDHSAFCLETQFYPDCVNHTNFPSCIIMPGIPFETTTKYKFGVRL
jgi:aldose 1-epimerase